MNFHGFEFEVISADKLDTYPNFNKAKHYCKIQSLSAASPNKVSIRSNLNWQVIPKKISI
ncbi:hypothetical protein [Pseudoalteromonas obscura]|uniref:Uncharacterized protein n=1 Tax=Pseudoalteromonas obscura TaxID=3048491 RepID=A0ABT7EPC6_9GAMM|nr:hypothetical protein [Pseudoalteromonas sp. P94(2023)]MDK2596906.1 hypothetical protein [Pseudoalteromonas sp. P94(2023)]